MATNCPQCGGTLPCSLHDRTLRHELLADPEKEFPWHELQKTKEWACVDTIYSITRLSDTHALVGGVGGVIKLLDVESAELTDLGNYGNYIYSIMPLSDTRALVGGVGGSAQLFEIPEHALDRYRKSKIAPPKPPPMPGRRF